MLDAGCPVTRFRTVKEVVEDDNLRKTGGLIELDEGDGPYLIVNTPMRFTNRDVGRRRGW